MSAVAKKYTVFGVLILLVAGTVTSIVGIRLAGTVLFGYNAISFGFQLALIVAYALAWDKVAKRSPKSLPMLYMSASGLRLLLAAVLLIVYMFANRATGNLPLFTIIFVAYYMVTLIYDTVFFVSVEKKRLQ